MILTALFWGTVIIGGIGIAAAFWNDLVDFIKEKLEKLKHVVYAIKVFLRKLGEAILETIRYYQQRKDGLVDEITETRTRTISLSDVPPDIQEKLKKAQKGQEVDITPELELKLANS